MKLLFKFCDKSLIIMLFVVSICFMDLDIFEMVFDCLNLMLSEVKYIGLS